MAKHNKAQSLPCDVCSLNSKAEKLPPFLKIWFDQGHTAVLWPSQELNRDPMPSGVKKPKTTIPMCHHRKFRAHQTCVRLTLPTGTLSFKTQTTISKSSSKGTIHFILKLVSCPFAGDFTSDLFAGQISLFYTVSASYTELYNTVIVSVCPPQWAAVTLYNIAADLCSDRGKHKGERATT